MVKSFFPQGMYKHSDGWIYKHIGKNNYVIYYGETENREYTISGTTENELSLKPPFPFRLNTVEIDFDDTTLRHIRVYIQRRHLNERTYKPKLKNIMDNIETNMRLYFDENDKFDAGD